jgi:hypothetical protein
MHPDESGELLYIALFLFIYLFTDRFGAYRMLRRCYNNCNYRLGASDGA